MPALGVGLRRARCAFEQLGLRWLGAGHAPWSRRSKTEVIQRKGPWRHLAAVEFATLTWVDWFNTRRLLEPIGYVPPAEL